jgi:hypothetical protein
MDADRAGQRTRVDWAGPSATLMCFLGGGLMWAIDPNTSLQPALIHVCRSAATR